MTTPASSERPLDVICLGRAAVDLYGHQIGSRLEDVQSFAKYVGGSSANCAVGLARLGRASSMLSRVGDEQMGRFVRESLARSGVDVSRLATDPRRLTGLVILGISGPDDCPHIFYRENCADLAIACGDFDRDYIASSRALAITGTHLSTAASAAVVAQAIDYAREAGTRVVLDIDFRPVLWQLVAHGEGASRAASSQAATAALQRVLPACDLIVGTEEEIRVAGGQESTFEALRAIRRLTPAAIVVKCGPRGCVIHPAEISADPQLSVESPGFAVEILNVLGAGDAFLAGFLHGWLDAASWQDCGRLGNACGALVVSRHGCAPALPSRVELEDFLARAATIRRPDLDTRLNDLHFATTVRRPRDELYVLAFDHRRQLEQLVGNAGKPTRHIEYLKGLIAAAVETVSRRSGTPQRIGVIVDARYGGEVISAATAAGRWIGRPVEIPGSRPLAFDPQNNMGLVIRDWPQSHVVKCLVLYHPDDPVALRLAQEERVLELHRDCIALERELLLEVIASASGLPVDDHTIARSLQRFYNLGIRPAWWKLEPQSASGWSEIDRVIAASDPWCNGVLLLGLDASEEALRTAFATAAPFAVCRGFAVGRSIFGHAARDWVEESIDDATVIDAVAMRYERLIHLWQATRAQADGMAAGID